MKNLSFLNLLGFVSCKALRIFLLIVILPFYFVGLILINLLKAI